MAAVNAVGGPKGSPPTVNFNADTLLNKGRKASFPQAGTQRVKPPKVEIDLQRFTQELKAKFKELEELPSFPKNLLVKLDVGLEFGVFVLPEQLFSKLTDADTNQTLKIQPPEFLLQHRVTMVRLIAEPAFQKVVSGLLVNEVA